LVLGGVCNQQICVNTRRQIRYSQPDMEATGTEAPPDRLMTFRGLCDRLFCNVTQICGVASQTAGRKVGGGVASECAAIEPAVRFVA
jgi:hypothetical protein